jgi:hypothetical protein
VALTIPILNPDGSLALIKGYQFLGTAEVHATKADIYFNWGMEHADSTFSLNSSGKAVGYGAPTFANYGCSIETVPGTSTPAGTTAGAGFIPGSLGNCTGDTKNIYETTVGFWYKPYKGPKGEFRIGSQYSYIKKDAWLGAGSVAGTTAAPTTNDSVWLTSMRYYLP